MGARRYGISLRVFNSIAYEWDVELNSRREISYIQATMYQFVYLIYHIHFKITGGPCNVIGSNWCDLFTIKNTMFFHVCCYGFSQGWKSLCNTVVYMVNRSSASRISVNSLAEGYNLAMPDTLWLTWFIVCISQGCLLWSLWYISLSLNLPSIGSSLKHMLMFIVMETCKLEMCSSNGSPFFLSGMFFIFAKLSKKI